MTEGGSLAQPIRSIEVAMDMANCTDEILVWGLSFGSTSLRLNFLVLLLP